MTTHTTNPFVASPGPVRSMATARRSRLVVIALLIGGLIVSTAARQWAMALQKNAFQSGPYAIVDGSGGTESSSSGGPSIGSMDSYFLVLLLGGLRGPLVMFLWASSESQKNERDLEDFDTKVNLIRLLQPEFDTVHIFQSWNKAYNISALIPSLPDRYGIILDAVDYLKSVDRSRPNNLNILMQLDQIYQHKLGSTTGDSVYYRKRIREDSQPRVVSAQEGVGALRLRMEPLLDASGNLVPKLTKAITARPNTLPARVLLTASGLADLKKAAEKAGVAVPADKISPSADGRRLTISLPEGDALRLQQAFSPLDVSYIPGNWNDGSELQYLERYQPFTYGVSPLALGYNYVKRAQVLMEKTKQKPAQFSVSVVDSRPGLELNGWGEEEMDLAVVAELKAFGLVGPADRLDKIGFLGSLRPDMRIANRAAMEEALFGFKRASLLFSDARAEYQRHMLNPDEGIRRLQDYRSKLDTLIADQYSVDGDVEYIQAMLAATPEVRNAHLRVAADKYVNGIAWNQYLDLQYYSPEDMVLKALPPGMKKGELESLASNPMLIAAVHRRMLDQVEQNPDADQNKDQRNDTAPFIRRDARRLAEIVVLLGLTPPGAQTLPTTKPAS